MVFMIRMLTEGDAPQLAKFRDEEHLNLGLFMHHAKTFNTEAAIASFIEENRRERKRWLVGVFESNELLGIGLVGFTHTTCADVAGYVRSGRRGEGVARSFFDWLFEALPRYTFFSTTEAQNFVSRRVLTAAGFTLIHRDGSDLVYERVQA